jgi:ubiquinone/menaquinone biosynthesis C-methylase UbiE
MGKKAYKGVGLEGIIGRIYAKSVEKVYEDYVEMAARIKKIITGKTDILEVASGPGYLSIELAKNADYNVTGLDISATLVEIANSRAQKEFVAVKFVVGNAADMPFAADQFDFVICNAAFNYFSEPLKALNEMQRVLKPGGKALVIDIRNDVTDEEIKYIVKRMQLGKLNSMLTSLHFKQVLRKRAYAIEQMEQLVRASNFEYYRIDKEWINFELWLLK